MKQCIGPCGLKLPTSCFGKGRNGSQRNVCKKCMGKKRSPEKITARIAWMSRYQKQFRTDNPARAIMVDSRRSDKRHGRANDLDLEFVQQMIVCPCAYCGESTLRMTLDRKDNDLGHLKSNVVTACIRCNYARGNMPYAAWLCLADGMRSARESGAFGDWIGRFTTMNNRP